MSATINHIGLPRDAYKGAATTLCAGCGHNSITNHMIKALHELGVEPHRLAKMSGIGCSSKTPAYFVETAHGFNGVHGRMPALTTGAHLANLQLIKAAIAHRGTAVLDIISPCVTFNDHDGSTKSYSWVKDHEESIADVSFIPFFEEVHVDYEPGTVRDVELHDGSHIVLKKLGEDHDPTDRRAAMKVIEEGRAAGHLVTGLLYLDTAMADFATTEHIPQRPLMDLGEDDLRLSPDQFAQFMSEFA